MAVVRRSILYISGAAVLFVGLAACSAPGTGPAKTPSSDPSVSSTPDGSPAPDAEEPDPVAFVLPATCNDFVGTTLENELLDSGNVFLLGPGGVGSATDYNPEFRGYQELGTPLYCVYGESLYEVIEFDVQALTPETYPAALAALTYREYVESTEGDAITYAQPGAVGITGAQLQVLRPDSWITVYNDAGGATKFDEMVEWLEVLTARVYPS